MTERTQDADLLALLDAVLSEGVSPERLAAYASNPKSLDPDERGRIERAISASPALADQVRVLQTFEVSAALGDSVATSHSTRPRGRDRRLDPPARRSRRLLGWAPAVAAIAAGIVLAVVFVQVRGREEDQLMSKVEAPEAELQRAREEVAQLEAELADARGTISQTREQVSTLERRASDLERQLAAAQAAERASHSEVLALRAEVERRAERIARLEEQRAGREKTPAIAEKSISKPDSFELEQPLQIAMVSVYDVPDPGAPVVRPILRSSHASGAAVPNVLAPERAGWTLQPQPTLYWHASRASNLRVEFVLTRERDDAQIARRDLPAIERSGIQRVPLSELGITLDAGDSYRWSVSFADPANPGRIVFAIGGIRLVARPASLRELGAQTPAPQRLDALERAGIWYDALDLVSRWIEQHPEASNLIARRDAMLARVGIKLD